MSVTLPRSVIEALGEEVAEDLAHWLDQVLQTGIVPLEMPESVTKAWGEETVRDFRYWLNRVLLEMSTEPPT